MRTPCIGDHVKYVNEHGRVLDANVISVRMVGGLCENVDLKINQLGHRPQASYVNYDPRGGYDTWHYPIYFRCLSQTMYPELANAKSGTAVQQLMDEADKKHAVLFQKIQKTLDEFVMMLNEYGMMPARQSELNKAAESLSPKDGVDHALKTLDAQVGLASFGHEKQMPRVNDVVEYVTDEHPILIRRGPRPIRYAVILDVIGPGKPGHEERMVVLLVIPEKHDANLQEPLHTSIVQHVPFCADGAPRTWRFRRPSPVIKYTENEPQMKELHFENHQLKVRGGGMEPVQSTGSNPSNLGFGHSKIPK